MRTDYSGVWPTNWTPNVCSRWAFDLIDGKIMVCRCTTSPLGPLKQPCEWEEMPLAEAVELLRVLARGAHDG